MSIFKLFCGLIVVDGLVLQSTWLKIIHFSITPKYDSFRSASTETPLKPTIAGFFMLRVGTSEEGQ